MAEVSTIGLDIAKHVFQAHGADASGHVVFRKKVSRGKLIEFFASQPRCVVALEADPDWVRNDTLKAFNGL